MPIPPNSGKRGEFSYVSKGNLPVTRYSILQPALDRAHRTKQALLLFFSL